LLWDIEIRFPPIFEPSLDINGTLALQKAPFEIVNFNWIILIKAKHQHIVPYKQDQATPPTTFNEPLISTDPGHFRGLTQRQNMYQLPAQYMPCTWRQLPQAVHMIEMPLENRRIYKGSR
jgi:hypothetical protein